MGGVCSCGMKNNNTLENPSQKPENNQPKQHIQVSSLLASIINNTNNQY